MLAGVNRVLIAVLALLAAAAASGPAHAGPCDARPLRDLALAAEADVVFVGRLVRADRRGDALTYRVVRALVGGVRKGQRVTVHHACPVRPDARDQLVFADAARRTLSGRDGVQRAQPARVAALAAWGAAPDDDARVAVLVGLYRDHHDPAALALLSDAPRLLARLDDAGRDALIREIGRAPWGTAEPVALARLGRPMALGLLTLADARCDDSAFDTPCGRAIPAALQYGRRPAPPKTTDDLVAAMQHGGDRDDRLRALAACEEQRGAQYDAGFASPGFSARLLAAPDVFPPGGQAGWERAAAWCGEGADAVDPRARGGGRRP